MEMTNLPIDLTIYLAFNFPVYIIGLQQTPWCDDNLGFNYGSKNYYILLFNRNIIVTIRNSLNKMISWRMATS